MKRRNTKHDMEKMFRMRHLQHSCEKIKYYDSGWKGYFLNPEKNMEDVVIKRYDRHLQNKKHALKKNKERKIRNTDWGYVSSPSYFKKVHNFQEEVWRTW